MACCKETSPSRQPPCWGLMKDSNISASSPAQASSRPCRAELPGGLPTRPPLGWAALCRDCPSVQGCRPTCSAAPCPGKAMLTTWPAFPQPGPGRAGCSGSTSGREVGQAARCQACQTWLCCQGQNCSPFLLLPLPCQDHDRQSVINAQVKSKPVVPALPTLSNLERAVQQHCSQN